MKTKRTTAAWVAVLCSLVLVGGAAAFASSPASAKAGINWGQIWKHKLQPKADKRYYKKSQVYSKAQSDGKYAAAGSSYSKAESDGKYAATGSSYSKAESDAKYAPFPSVVRGTYTAVGDVTAAGQHIDTSFSYGVNLATAPAVTYLNAGAAPTAACPGSVAAPTAAPGNLCVYESLGSNVTTRRIFNANGTFGLSSTFGANVEMTATAAGQVYVYGSWAVHPAGAVSSSKVIKAPHTGGVRAGR